MFLMCTPLTKRISFQEISVCFRKDQETGVPNNIEWRGH